MITAYFDGGARSNPGPAGYGVYIVDDAGTVVAELSGSLGIATNNVAEYNGLLAALQWAIDNDITALTVKGDSLLIIEQMRGNYKVKNEGLKPLHMQARMLVVQPDGVLQDRIVGELPQWLEPGDQLVVNDTKVISAQLKGRRIGRETEPKIEATLIKRLDGSRWQALVKPAKK